MTETSGQAIHRRRIALGIHTEREWEQAAGVARKTLRKIEADDPTVKDSTRRMVEAALDRLEEEAGEGRRVHPGTITMPDGTTIVYPGTPEEVALFASRFVDDQRRRHGRNGQG